MNICAVIMCSGLSRRMGKNKLLMEFKGHRLFEYTVDAVKECGFSKIIVTTAYDEIADYCKDLTVVRNSSPEEGISVSVRLGTEEAQNSDGIMFFTADQPFITKAVIKELIEAFEANNNIIVPVCDGMYKNPVIFPLHYSKELMALHGDVGGKKVYMAHKDDICGVLFDDIKPFLDFDTEDDIKKFQPQ
ncbi:MAG: nucleotidyltransferase family protein [Clostridiales bacterium]|nr:nucleotidyltransferase family protein [Clostridiales bacterium]